MLMQMQACVFRELIDTQRKLCGQPAYYMLNGNSLCHEHALTVHETGSVSALFNTPR
jgi:hypothetical protein